MKQEPKSKISYPNLILVITGITIILFSAYNIISLGLIQDKKASVLNTLENEYYVVGKDPTPYQKETFELLSDQLKESQRDYSIISELVAKSFVIDFFGWSNKDSAFDIGGLQYMKDPESFNSAAHWEYYQKLDVFNTTYGKGKLPEVKNVSASTSKDDPFLLGNRPYPAYKVKLNWTYDNSAGFSIKEFVNSSEITLIEESGKVSIVDIKMIDELDELDELDEVDADE